MFERFGLWAKVSVRRQKLCGRVAISAFHVSPAKLWDKNDWSKLYHYHFSRILNELFLILTKKGSQVCRNSNLNVQKKNVIRKRSWTLDLSPFLKSTRKACFVNGKFFAGLSKILFTYPEEHLQSNVSERKSYKLKDFWINFEVFGTTAENNFQGWQNSNKFQGEQFMEKSFSKKKI